MCCMTSSGDEFREEGEVYDVSMAIEKIGFGRFQIVLMVLVASIWMADAMEMMLLSFLAPAVACEWQLSNSEKAWGPQAVFIGMMIGAPFWGWYEDRFGRRMCYFACTLGALLAGIATVFSVNYHMLVACRACVGFAVAGSHCAVVLYMEFLPMAWRAFGVVMLGVFWAIGAVLEALLAYAVMAHTSNEMGWRLLVLFSALPLAILLMFWPWLPESARWDLQHGNRKRALETLEWGAKLNRTSLPEGQLAESPAAESRSEGSCLDMCRGPKMLAISLMLGFVWIVAAMGYYGVVLLNTELFQEEANGERCSIYDAAKKLTRRPAHRTGAAREAELCARLTTEDYQDAVIDSLGELPGLALAFFLMDRTGRRGALAVTCTIFGIVVAMLLYCWGRTVENVLLFLGRGSIDGAFQIVFIFTPEIYPTSIRGTAIGIFSMLARIGGVATPQVALVLLPMSNQVGLGLYAGLSFLAAIAGGCMPVETAGKELADDVVPTQASARDSDADSKKEAFAKQSQPLKSG